MLVRRKELYFIFGFKEVSLQPGSVIRIAPLSLLTLDSISLVLRSAPSAYACYASGAVLVRD